MKNCNINNIFSNEIIGAKVQISGWVRSKRCSSNMAFFVINDGSTIKNLQIVVDLKKVKKDVVEKINVGCSIEVVGIITKSAASGQDLEMQLLEVKLLGNAENYPIQPKKHTMENFIAIVTLAIIMYPLIGFLAESSTIAFSNIGVGFLNSILISLISGMILIFIMLLVVFYISTISYRRGLDPDNIVIPLSTSLTDSISTLILIVVSLGLLSLI